jgi:hypothetical protein
MRSAVAVAVPFFALLLPGCELASGVGRYHVDERDCRYADEVSADGPASYWRLDDAASSTTARDELGRRDGQLQGGAFGADGLVGCGSAVTLAGQAEQVVIGDHFAFEGNAPFTVEAWVSNNVPGDVVSRRDGTAVGWMLRGTTTGTAAMIRFIGVVGLFEGAESSVVPAGPAHLVGRYDPADGIDTACIFVNGAKNSCNAAPTPIGRATSPLSIGGSNFSGVLDEVAIYDYPLSDERIGAHFNAAAP